MSNFGDFDIDDAFDPSPADPEQVARRLQALRVEAGIDSPWDTMTPAMKLVLIAIIDDLLGWLRREGSMR